MGIRKESFGRLADGTEIFKYTMTNTFGASVEIITLGGAIRALRVPDRNGALDDVVCGYDTPQEYLDGDQCQGALIGRFANRIKGGRFTLNGKEYVLPKNYGENSLHGGFNGFSRKVWTALPKEGKRADKLIMKMTSPDGEEGFPGKLRVQVTMAFDNENALTICS